MYILEMRLGFDFVNVCIDDSFEAVFELFKHEVFNRIKYEVDIETLQEVERAFYEFRIVEVDEDEDDE